MQDIMRELITFNLIIYTLFILFNKYDFELINGYSNEYTRWGASDDDLLSRCYEKKLPMDVEWIGDPSKTTRPLTFVNFDGKKSFVEIHSNKVN